MIDCFRRKYQFLSNYFACPIEYNGLTYKNAEAAFQAQKTLNLDIRKRFTVLDPPDAKRLGRRVSLRPDWEDVKYSVMDEICHAKFEQHPNLLKKLLATKNENLIEGNTWGDTYWGVCNGVGQNNLGKILMNIRKEYQEKESQ